MDSVWISGMLPWYDSHIDADTTEKSPENYEYRHFQRNGGQVERFYLHNFYNIYSHTVSWP